MRCQPLHCAAMQSLQALQEQLLDDAISKAVAEAFLAEKIQALDRPSVDIKKYVPGDLLEFTAEVDVLPPVKLGDYKKLGVKAKKVTVKKEDMPNIRNQKRLMKVIFFEALEGFGPVEADDMEPGVLGE